MYKVCLAKTQLPHLFSWTLCQIISTILLIDVQLSLVRNQCYLCLAMKISVCHTLTHLIKAVMTLVIAAAVARSGFHMHADLEGDLQL